MVEQRKLKIIWSKTAEIQLQNTLMYWLKRNGSPSYPQKLYDTISERIELLSYYPEIGKTTNFRNILQISLGHYSILYRITDESILIYAIWANRDDPKKLYELMSKRS